MLLAALPWVADGSDAKPLNVVLITLDTTRADAISGLGGVESTTPNLDQLAQASTFFSHARSDSNVTNPSHVSILSGLRAIDHQVISNFVTLPATVETIADAARGAGWHTAAFVSARHVGRELGWRGFEVFPAVDGKRTAIDTTDLAVAWLRGGRGEQPFFLWVHYWEPHMLYTPSESDAARFYAGDRLQGAGEPIAQAPFLVARDAPKVAAWLGETRDPEWARAMYAAEVHATDREIGRLLATLGAGARESTLVVVTADHGESLGEHGVFYGHAGLYEQQIRVPLIMSLPGAPHRRIDEPVSTLDIAPTVSDLAGIPFERKGLAGQNLAALVRGQRTSGAGERVFIHQNAHNLAAAVHRGSWKFIRGFTDDHPVLGRPPQLFDLATDPGERINLAPEHPEVVTEMTVLLQPWLQVGVVEKGDRPALNDEIVEQLRALGYVQ